MICLVTVEWIQVVKRHEFHIYIYIYISPQRELRRRRAIRMIILIRFNSDKIGGPHALHGGAKPDYGSPVCGLSSPLLWTSQGGVCSVSEQVGCIESERERRIVGPCPVDMDALGVKFLKTHGLYNIASKT